MAKLFFVDLASRTEYTYDNFYHDISNETIFVPICKSQSFYTVFKQIIISLIEGREIVLLDFDFSEAEIILLLGNKYKDEYQNSIIRHSENISFDFIQSKINSNIDKWRITLFTSGTTGQPKKISHTFDSITRNVIKDEKRLDNVWGYAYNPTHMAGLQVFFQAFLNQNPIVRLFGLDRKQIFEQIDRYQITNISATPTFYRLLLPADRVCLSVKKLTSGGEKFDSTTLNLLLKLFPSSKIRNVYASTEAGSLFSSNGEVFTIRKDLEHLIKIENNEVFINKSLLGDSSNITLINNWYATGDIIQIISYNPLSFKFVLRKNEMINTGGYKVNPHEVEESIRLIKGVSDVFVYGKKNSLLGNLVCCEVVKSDEFITEKAIRDFLKDKLQEFKIPRIVKFVDKLSTTRTGKLSRK